MIISYITYIYVFKWHYKRILLLDGITNIVKMKGIKRRKEEKNERKLNVIRYLIINIMNVVEFLLFWINKFDKINNRI